MVEFVYNNAKNTITSYILLVLNCRYHYYVSYKEEFNPCLKLKTMEKQSSKLQI